jgi:hypothetical protein
MRSAADGQPKRSRKSAAGFEYCQSPCGTRIESSARSRVRDCRLRRPRAPRPRHQRERLLRIARIVAALLHLPQRPDRGASVDRHARGIRAFAQRRAAHLARLVAQRHVDVLEGCAWCFPRARCW